MQITVEGHLFKDLILCPATREPRNDLECLCCPGDECFQKYGSFNRLRRSFHATPWKYPSWLRKIRGIKR